MGTVNALGDHKRTIAYANRALERIRHLGQPGDPRGYGAWFAYATNRNPSQNIIVDQTIAREGGISPADLEKLYGYAPADAMSGKVDDLAASVAGEVEQVIALIDAAVRKVAACRSNIGHVARRLDRAEDREDLRAIVETLLQAAQGMEAANGSLAASLQASKQEFGKARQQAEALRIGARADALTSLANREHFDRELERCMADAAGADEDLCLLLMDIDRFNETNVMFGHVAGDEVLRAVAASLRQHVQPNDVAARVGGDEFAVILPRLPLHSALIVADHIRCRVMTMQFTKRSTGERIGRLTISGGIARYRPGEGAWAFMQRADNCLSAAKRHGRNRVICDDDGLADVA